MFSKRAVPFAALGRMCLKGDVFFPREVLFRDEVQIGARAPGSVAVGHRGSNQMCWRGVEVWVQPKVPTQSLGMSLPRVAVLGLVLHPMARSCKVCRVPLHSAALPHTPQPPSICLSH